MPHYDPDATTSEVFLERAYLAGDFVNGVGYGAQLVLYASCVLYLWRQRRQRNMYLLAYITLLIIVESIFVAVQARTVQVVYIDNRNYPGGPWEYFLDSQYLAINVTFYATLFAMTFLADILVLWRCWVIWSSSGRRTTLLVTSFPMLMTLGSFVMGVLWTQRSNQPGLSVCSSLPMAYGTAYFAISLSLNVILTILITTRLLMYRRAVINILPTEHASPYISLASIFIESAALYSVFAIVFLVTYVIGNPVGQVFLSVASASQQIAAYLIIYRVAEGRAWKNGTPQMLSTQMLSTINFVVPSTLRTQGESKEAPRRSFSSTTLQSSNPSTAAVVEVGYGLEHGRKLGSDLECGIETFPARKKSLR